MNALIIGKRGQVARALKERAARRGMSAMIAGRPELDLAKLEGTLPFSAGAVLNAAAYTQVDRAEDDIVTVNRINSEAVGTLARASASASVFVHFSTDYVFSGADEGFYVESDLVDPVNAYGASKLAGEREALANHPRTVILRTSWVYDAEGANFVRTMLRLAKTRDELGVVADQHGCPTFSEDLADVALTIAAAPRTFGVYHCAGEGETTWAGFAEEIFRLSREFGGPSAIVKPIATADFPTRAKRPANSRLDCTKLAREYGIRPRPWREALEVCVEKIARGGWSVE